MKIITLTMNPTIDINSRAEKVIPERKLRCESPAYEAGGGGVNVSRAIKKLGGKSLSVYTSGGENGKMLKGLLEKEKIDTLEIPVSEMTRESITISDLSANQQYRFVMPGPSLKKNEWKRSLEIIKNLDEKPEYIVASGSLPKNVPDNFYAEVAKIGNELNIKVIVDTNKQPLCMAVEEGVFLIKPNMNELNDLTKKEIKSESDIEKFSRELLNKNKCEVIVVSLGAGGALFVTKSDAIFIKSPTVPIKSKVGAGDSMLAGIVLRLSQGNDLLESVKYGVAAGAAAVMTPGTELCRKEDTDRLYKSMR